jgi:hypothetical protein
VARSSRGRSGVGMGEVGCWVRVNGLSEVRDSSGSLQPSFRVGAVGARIATDRGFCSSESLWAAETVRFLHDDQPCFL